MARDAGSLFVCFTPMTTSLLRLPHLHFAVELAALLRVLFQRRDERLPLPYTFLFSESSPSPDFLPSRTSSSFATIWNIIVNGQPLTEYADPAPAACASPHVSVYAEANEPVQFEMWCKLSPPFAEGSEAVRTNFSSGPDLTVSRTISLFDCKDSTITVQIQRVSYLSNGSPTTAHFKFHPLSKGKLP